MHVISLEGYGPRYNLIIAAIHNTIEKNRATINLIARIIRSLKRTRQLIMAREDNVIQQFNGQNDFNESLQ